MDMTGSMLQGGSQPQLQGTQGNSTQLPSLNDHANTLMQTALSLPPDHPMVQTLANTATQLAQAHAESQTPPDGYAVRATDGKMYIAPTPELAAQFKEQYGMGTLNPANPNYKGAGGSQATQTQQPAQGLSWGQDVNNFVQGLPQASETTVANVTQIPQLATTGYNVANAFGASNDQQRTQIMNQPRDLSKLGLGEVSPDSSFLGGAQQGFAVAGTVMSAGDLASTVKGGVGDALDTLSGWKANWGGGAPPPGSFTPVVEEGTSAVAGEAGQANMSAAENLNQANQGLTEAQQSTAKAEEAANAAAKAADEAPPKAVAQYESMQKQITGKKSALSTQLGETMKTIPGQSTISPTQVQAIRNTIGAKNLPDFLTPETSPLSGEVSPDFAKLNADKIAAFQNGEQINLNAEEANKLMGQMNGKYYSSDITNELRTQFSNDFGEPWDTARSDYGKGVNAFKRIDDIITPENSYNPKTASEQEAEINKLLKLSKSPTGKVLLQNAISDVQAVHPDINLSDPVATIQQVQETQDAAEAAQGGLTEAQKAQVAQEKAVQQAQKEFAATQDDLQAAKAKADKAQADLQAEQKKAADAAKAAIKAKKLKTLKTIIKVAPILGIEKHPAMSAAAEIAAQLLLP